MMGTSILSIPWGIKQVSVPSTHVRSGLPAASSPRAEESCLSLQAGFTLGILILVFTGLLMLYCCYIVLQAPKPIRESTTHLHLMLLVRLLLPSSWRRLCWLITGSLQQSPH